MQIPCENFKKLLLCNSKCLLGFTKDIACCMCRAQENNKLVFFCQEHTTFSAISKIFHLVKSLENTVVQE